MLKYIIKDGSKYKVYKEVSSTTVTLDKFNIRYIRDYINGSSANGGNHWVEIQAINSGGTNVALNKTVKAVPNDVPPGKEVTKLVDGDTNTNNYCEISVNQSTGPFYMEIDLGSAVQVSSIKVWHYNADGRTYYKTKTQVSQDGVKWITVFDSDVSGTYAESSSGKTTNLSTISTTTKVYGVEEVADASVATFTASGMTEELLKIGLTAIAFESSSIQVLTCTDETNYNKSLKITGTPKDLEILKMNYDFNMTADNITGIKSSLIEFVKENALDNIRIVFSLDSGATWKSIVDSALVDVTMSSEQDILDKGLTTTKFNSLVQAELDLLYSRKKIRYAICLKELDMDKKLAISKLRVLYK